MEIDKTKPVLVTGATGYVAGWLVKDLLDQGFNVHAAVRNPDDKAKIGYLEKLASQAPGDIRFFRSDLLKDGSYAEAMTGCEVVFHTASPYTMAVQDPQKELIEPAVKGTENVLNQASKTASVKRIVLTSSCAAIYTDAKETQQTENGELTEQDWNTTASLTYQPYFYSKTLAEKRAWELAKSQKAWDLVVMNPPAVYGPFLNPQATTSESFNQIKQLGDGTLKQGAPNIGIGVIDVRDLAEAHMRAAFNPSAAGRYIVNGHNTSFLEMAQILHSAYGNEYPVPNKAIPKWLLVLIGPLVDKAITRRFVLNNVNYPWRASNAKIKRELDMSFRPIKETLIDSFQGLIEAGVLKARSP